MGFYGFRFSINNTDWLFVRKDAISFFDWTNLVVTSWLRRAFHGLRLSVRR